MYKNVDIITYINNRLESLGHFNRIQINKIDQILSHIIKDVKEDLDWELVIYKKA